MSKHWKIVAESLRLMLERERIAHYLEHQAEIHDQLATEAAEEEGTEWHKEMAQQFRQAARVVRSGQI